LVVLLLLEDGLVLEEVSKEEEEGDGEDPRLEVNDLNVDPHAVRRAREVIVEAAHAEDENAIHHGHQIAQQPWDHQDELGQAVILQLLE